MTADCLRNTQPQTLWLTADCLRNTCGALRIQVREGALLRDEIIALRGKIADLTAEKDLLRAQLEAEKGKGRELEGLLQVLLAAAAAKERPDISKRALIPPKEPRKEPEERAAAAVKVTRWWAAGAAVTEP